MHRTLVGFLVVLAAATNSCKSVESTSSSRLRADELKADASPGEQSGEAVNCGCGDMQCWRKATNDGVKDQLACAKDAMEKVVPVIGPILDLATTAIELQDGIASLADVMQISKEVLKARNSAAGFPSELSCIVDIATAFEGAMEPFKNFQSAAKLFTDSPSFENAKALGDMLKTTYDAATKFSSLITRENQNCVVDPTKKEWKSWNTKLDLLKTKPRGFFQSFITRSKDLVKSPIDKINVARTIYSCGARILKGARTLYSNTQCLVDDLKALEDSKLAVARSLAYVGSRQYNHARYIGCTQCVYSSYRDSTETEYHKCREKCESRGPNAIGSYQRVAWVASCQLTCGTARTEGLFWDYTDEAVCNEVKNMFPVSRRFRQLPLVPHGTPAAEQRGKAESQRARILAALKQIEGSFGHVSAFWPEGRGEFVERPDLQGCAAQVGFSRDLRDACAFFAADEQKAWFGLLDGATDGGNDGFVGTTDLRYFHDEVSEYRDDSEYDRADAIDENLAGCKDWGKDAMKNESWGCDFNKAFKRCGEHADHRSSTVERFRPLRMECVGHCMQGWAAAREGC